MRTTITISIIVLLISSITAIFQFYPHISSSISIQKQEEPKTFWSRFKIPLYKGPLLSTPDLSRLEQRLADKKLKMGNPIFIRIFKKENLLELWIKRQNQFVLFSTYPICNWSGYLGPKLKQGDYQAPEGFYTVSKSQLNPNSRFHRSFNLGYPNLYDKAHKRTGDYLMVHGNCVSAGCYAMTDPVITELWAFVTAALNKGQKRFHVHAFPFRMTEINLALHNNNKWHPFWMSLKPGYDSFENTKKPPQISICKTKYQVSPAGNNTNGSSKLHSRCL